MDRSLMKKRPRSLVGRLRIPVCNEELHNVQSFDELRDASNGRFQHPTNLCLRW